MRTTLSIDDDVMERARAVAAKLSTPFKTVVNEALRAGLDHVEKPAKQRGYKTKPHKMGLRQGCNLDTVQELLAQIEGEGTRGPNRPAFANGTDVMRHLNVPDGKPAQPGEVLVYPNANPFGERGFQYCSL